jgi:hypothetical protein
MSKWTLYWLAFVLVFAGGSYHYDCNIKRVCRAPTAIKLAMPPLSFRLSAAETLTTEAFPEFKAAVLARGKPGDVLAITGLAFADEPQAPAGQVDLSLLRAQNAARLFANDLVPERIQVNTRRVTANVDPNAAQFEAVEFNWVALIAPLASLEMRVAPPLAFEANSDLAILSDSFPAMVQALNTGAEDQQLEITGLWFDGEREALGLARAAAARASLAPVINANRVRLGSTASDRRQHSPARAPSVRPPRSHFLKCISPPTRPLQIGMRRSVQRCWRLSNRPASKRF